MQRERQVAALHRAIADTEARSKRLLRNFELVDDPDQDMGRDIAERRIELRSERVALQQKLAALEDEEAAAPNPGLLRALPVGPVELDELPEDLSRRLFEALRLEVRYNRATNIATCRVTLTGETIPATARVGVDAVKAMQDVPRQINREEAVMPVQISEGIMHGSAWCPQRDSNPCYRLERATSWAARRWGRGDDHRRGRAGAQPRRRSSEALQA